MKIGFTCSCFDLLHAGHILMLKDAKEQCDYLIVGVSTDELVKSYKNKEPIIPFKHRCEIVAALNVVDEVIAQKNRNKIKQFQEINYDVLFVGDDWKGSPIFNELEAELKDFNVEIKYFEYTKDVSSSKLKSILQNIYNLEDA